MPPANWPQLILEGGFTATVPVQPGGVLLLDDAVNGLLDTNTLAGDNTWTDLTQWLRSGSVARPASRQQGPIYSYQPGTLAAVLNNRDGRFDPDNLGGPYVAAGATELTAMTPIRIRAVWAGVTYPLFAGFTDSWTDDGQNYAGHYAEASVAATDAQKVLAGMHLDTDVPAGSGETTGARVNRILTRAGWYTGSGQRTLAPGDSTVQATTFGDTPWNLMQITADSEIGELYVSGAGAVVFRNRQALLEDTRSNTSQAVFGDGPGELPFRFATRARDDTTIANDIQGTRANGGVMQEAFDQASLNKYLFARTYQRTDLILENDQDVSDWANWVLYVAKNDEDRFDQLVIYPLRDPVRLWPQALGRLAGDRITVTRRPPVQAAIPYSAASVTSPGTFQIFLAVPVAPGTYTVSWTVTLAGTVAAAEANNFAIGLNSGAGVTTPSVNAGTAGTYPQPAVTITTAVADSIVVKSWSAAPTAGAVYGAMLPSPVTRDCFIRGIGHQFDVSAGSWVTTWTLQDASRYGSFLTLNHPVLGQLDENALTF